VTLLHVLERRQAKGTVEFRAAEGDDGTPVLEGYAAVFNRWSVDLGGFRERIAPGAFTKTVREADVVALWNHDDGHLLGRIASGTLTLKVDDHGLRYRVELPDTSTGRDVAELARRGDVQGSSFGFRTIEDRWDEDDEGNLSRTLLEVALIDVSPVSRPAYPDTDAHLRSVARAIEAHTHHRPDLAEVREALSAHHLGRLIAPAPADEADAGAPPVEDEHADEGDDDGRAEPTAVERPRLLHLYA
jgi:HK97 family phage prohead protease